MKVKGYFFDLDGTLVDTHESNASAYFRAISEVIGENRVERSVLLREISKGKSCDDFLRDLIPKITGEDICRIAKRKAEVYAEYLDVSTLNGKLVESIKRWRKEPGTIIALVTTAKRRNAMNVIEHHGIEELFDVKVFGDDVESLKPDPEIYIKALEMSGVEADNAEAFEDSDVGMESAVRAGIRANRVVWDE